MEVAQRLVELGVVPLALDHQDRLRRFGDHEVDLATVDVAEVAADELGQPQDVACAAGYKNISTGVQKDRKVFGVWVKFRARGGLASAGPKASST
jgi:hypothetical protein